MWYNLVKGNPAVLFARYYDPKMGKFINADDAKKSGRQLYAALLSNGFLEKVVIG